MNLIHNTKVWLLDNNILVPDDWVIACVEWIQEENQGVPQSQEEINSLVYQQWLLADLHELETRCLPSSALTADKFQLTGAYPLQIDCILDVGQSFYSQQQKVKGTENANVGVSAEEQLKPWEQKPTRMLMFKLTDGSQTMQGMEYKPISCLSPQTQPGSKILVHGSVLCRHGILMLTENNVKFLGGEVDTLIEANTQLNVLESAMEASTEHAGKSHRQEFDGSQARPSQRPISEPRGQRFGDHQAMGQGIKREAQSQGFVKPKSKVKKEIYGSQTQQINDTIDDQWDDDQMFDALVDDMEIDNFQQAQPSNLYRTQPGNNSHSGQTQAAPINKGSSSRSRVGTDTNDNQPTEDAVDNMKLNINSRGGSKRSVKRDLSINLTKREATCRDAGVTSEIDHCNALPMKRQKVVSTDDEDMNCFEEDIDYSEINDYEQLDTGEIDQNSAVISANSEFVSNSNHTGTDNQKNTVSVKHSNIYQSKRQGFKALKSEPALPSVNSQSVKNQPQEEETKCIEQFFPPDRLSPAAKVLQGLETVSDAGSEYPFTYLSKVLKKRPQETRIVTVKAYISTLTSKLSSDGGRWSLSCKINDGTMACDVDLSDKVLTDLIGFSAKEAMDMKVRARSDRTVKDKLQKGIQQCQQELIDLMCLMELDVGSKNMKPSVVAIKHISPNDIELLLNRVTSSRCKLTS